MNKTASGYRLIFGYLGLFIAFVGIATLLPLFAYIGFPDEIKDWYCFVIPGGSAIVVGSLLFGFLVAGKTKAQLGKHQDFVLLVLIWVTAIFISAVPFLIKGNLSFTNAIFETTSAYATIGLTVFEQSDLDLHAFVLYRSILCFVGGIGLVLIVTSAISDRYGLKLYVAEGHNDKLMPNLARSARIILSIYFGITLLGVLLYCIAGMSPFDAIIHSISGVATGGFSSRTEGIMAFKDLPTFWAIQVISIFLMIAGATNFLLTFFIITGKFKKAFRDCELRLFGVLALVFIPLFIIAAYFGGEGLSFGEAVVQGPFTYISAITTTGFSNAQSMRSLGQTTIFLVTIVNIIGGGIGSTAGGVKQYRLAIALKSFAWSTRENTASSNVIFPHYVSRFGEQREIDSKEVSSAFGYILLYVVIMLAGGFLVTIFNSTPLNYGDGLFEFSNAISSTGLSFGIYKYRSLGVRWTLIAGMFAGRLEILPIYYALFRVARDILRKETY